MYSILGCCGNGLATAEEASAIIKLLPTECGASGTVAARDNLLKDIRWQKRHRGGKLIREGEKLGKKGKQ